MPKLISITSGSKPILLNIIKRNFNHNLHLYKSNTEDTFNLIDWFPSNSIFKSPINYKILYSNDVINYGPFINLFYFTLSHKVLKILIACVKKQLGTGLPNNMTSLFLTQSTKNSSQIMVGTVWSNSQSYLKWIKTSFIHSLLYNHSNNGFYNNLTQLR